MQGLCAMVRSSGSRLCAFCQPNCVVYTSRHRCDWRENTKVGASLGRWTGSACPDFSRLGLEFEFAVNHYLTCPQHLLSMSGNNQKWHSSFDNEGRGRVLTVFQIQTVTTTSIEQRQSSYLWFD